MHGPDDMKSVRLAEERPRAVHGVEAFGLALGQVRQAHRADGEARLSMRCENLRRPCLASTASGLMMANVVRIRTI